MTQMEDQSKNKIKFIGFVKTLNKYILKYNVNDKESFITLNINEVNIDNIGDKNYTLSLYNNIINEYNKDNILNKFIDSYLMSKNEKNELVFTSDNTIVKKFIIIYINKVVDLLNIDLNLETNLHKLYNIIYSLSLNNIDYVKSGLIRFIHDLEDTYFTQEGLLYSYKGVESVKIDNIRLKSNKEDVLNKSKLYTIIKNTKSSKINDLIFSLDYNIYKLVGDKKYILKGIKNDKLFCSIFKTEDINYIYTYGSVVTENNYSTSPKSCLGGLHFSNKSYAEQWSNNNINNKIINVLVHIKDVVSIPSDNHVKARTKKYYILDPDEPIDKQSNKYLNKCVGLDRKNYML